MSSKKVERHLKARELQIELEKDRWFNLILTDSKHGTFFRIFLNIGSV